MKNKEVKSEITFLEACKILKKSKKTISRYIKKGLITPERIKSQRGTLEYRFKRDDLENFKKPETGQIRQDTRQDSEIITLLKETTQVLKNQLKVKDEQIKSLLERSRENNILLKGLQNKVLMLESKDENRGDRPDEKRQDRGQKIKVFIDYIKGKFFK